MGHARDPKSMICTSIRARSLNEMTVKALKSATNLVELRLDTLPPVELAEIDQARLRDTVISIRHASKRVILTFRGGVAYSKGRSRIMDLMVKAEPDYIDLDMHADPIDDVLHRVSGTETTIIASYHNAEGTPGLERLKDIMEDALAKGAGIVKIITTARRFSDNLVNLTLTSLKPGKVISFSMGALGAPSRILAPFFGAPFTYASYSRGEETAPGQIEAREVISIWSMMGLT